MRGNSYYAGDGDRRIATRSRALENWRAVVPITLVDVVGSAIVALWLVYQPSVIERSMALDFATTYSAATATSQEVNRLLKGNRLDVKVRQPGPSDHDRYILIGCEPAFSLLVEGGYFSGRCITGIDSFSKLVASLGGPVS